MKTISLLVLLTLLTLITGTAPPRLHERIGGGQLGNCPPEHDQQGNGPTQWTAQGDMDGDGTADWKWNKERVDSHGKRVTVRCLSRDGGQFALVYEDKIVGICPYEGGRNRATLTRDKPGGKYVTIEWSSRDKGPDDDGDKSADEMVYTYDVSTNMLTALNREGSPKRDETRQTIPPPLLGSGELPVAFGITDAKKSTALSRVLFENDDFKVFAVKDPEVLPSISGPASFGVVLLNDRYASVLRSASHLSFLGSSGRRSLLVYGNPAGVLPLIDRTSFLNSGADLTWVVPKSDAKITEPVFRKDLPESFTKWVQDDVFAIGALADTAAAGQRPIEKALALARAAIDDLAFKSRWFSFYRKPAEAPEQICVKVRTLRGGQEIQDWTVRYVRKGQYGYGEAYIKEFDQHSSPTEQCISAGAYMMWAIRDGKSGEHKKVDVGDGPGANKELHLRVP